MIYLNSEIQEFLKHLRQVILSKSELSLYLLDLSKIIDRKFLTFFGNLRNSVVLLDMMNLETNLTLSRRKSITYRNQSIALQNKSMDWFLHD